MIRRSALVVAALLAVLPALASAQETGTRLGPHNRAKPSANLSLSEADRSRKMMLDYARCLIGVDEQGVRAMTTSFPESQDYARRARRISTDACVADGMMTFNANILRASLFTAFYLREFGRAPAPLAATPIDFKADAAGQNADEANRYVVMRQFAECVVRADPAASRAVVLGPIGSAAEDEAFRAIAPQLAPCLPQGSSIKAGRTVLSGLIAEVLYRLATTTPTASAGKS